MSLPNPLPDNPFRWEGWKKYNSPNFYERLCLSQEGNIGTEQIEENCRQLLVWWQKKLPLKNQPSNPLSQLLRAGLDEAPVFLVEARTELLNPEARARIDTELHQSAVLVAIEEFKKIVSFSLSNKQLTQETEDRLGVAGRQMGLSNAELQETIEVELERLGAARVVDAPPPPPPIPVPVPVPEPVFVPIPVVPVAVAPPQEAPAPSDPASEFRRILRLSKLCLDGDDMSDDQRDAMCNMGESLGLTGGQAEDAIDEYLEAMSNPTAPAARPAAAPAVRPAAAPTKPAVVPGKLTPAASAVKVVNTSPLARAQERQQFANFANAIAADMLLVTSGAFIMGSVSSDAADNERPLTPVTIGCFYMARFPVTNAQYELFDPAHRSFRAPWADDHHPVVYVSSLDAEKFCLWLSQREGRKYRLPSEAEWEYAARGWEGRIFPWGERLDAGCFANFADRRTGFPWRDTSLDDGYAETNPVGAFPKGASPFGIEELSGNVNEWCLDFLETYKGKERTNPRGPTTGNKRVYRGGSWKSRANSLRTTARHFNDAGYASNDVGFRLVCECQ